MHDSVMVHGRFQPFHNEHLDYVLEGLRRARGQVVVGITNPFPCVEPEHASTHDSHRHDPGANPYTFLERARMVQQSLLREGVDLSRVTVIPFQLDALERCAVHPSEVVQLVNVIDPWDVEKCARFAAAGFAVEVFRRPRGMSASAVRRALEGGAAIDHLVPSGTLTVLDALGQARVCNGARTARLHPSL